MEITNPTAHTISIGRKCPFGKASPKALLSSGAYSLSLTTSFPGLVSKNEPESGDFNEIPFVPEETSLMQPFSTRSDSFSPISFRYQFLEISNRWLRPSHG